jgi:hypothetical protein
MVEYFELGSEWTSGMICFVSLVSVCLYVYVYIYIYIYIHTHTHNIEWAHMECDKNISKITISNVR